MSETNGTSQDADQEIILADQFVFPLGEGYSHGAEKSFYVPVVLCDDKLVEEIHSIPPKMGFKIGEVAELLGIKQYVLRYWESEFDILNPRKASNNQRYYTQKDVETTYLIRKLLHRDRFSIEGARSAMKELKNHVKKEKVRLNLSNEVGHRLSNIRKHIQDLLSDIRRVKSLFS